MPILLSSPGFAFDGGPASGDIPCAAAVPDANTIPSTIVAMLYFKPSPATQTGEREKGRILFKKTKTSLLSPFLLFVVSAGELVNSLPLFHRACGDRSAAARHPHGRRMRPELLVGRGAPAGQSPFQELLLGLFDRNPRDAGLLVDPAVVQQPFVL